MKNTAAVAKLDAADVYLGVEYIDEDALTPEHVPLPNGCDLPIGKYKWDRGAASFVPLRTDKQVKEQEPVMLNALAIALIAINDKFPLPAETLAWLDYYIKTVDFIAPMSEETTRLCGRFQQREKNGNA